MISTPRKSQQGMALLVGLIMLVMITLMVTSAFTMSSSTFKSVNNMQNRDEAIAAAKFAIEQVTESPFTDAPVAQTLQVDIDSDGTDDYTVTVAKPKCVKVTLDIGSSLSSVSLPTMSSSTNLNSSWDLRATVRDVRTGARTVVEAGVTVVIDEAKMEAVCLV